MKKIFHRRAIAILIIVAVILALGIAFLLSYEQETSGPPCIDWTNRENPKSLPKEACIGQ